MTGSTKKMSEREAIIAAMQTPPTGGYFVWDGQNEDDRPATLAELSAAMESYRAKRGRPVGSGTKEQVAIRLDRDVLAAFRASGTGWQTRMNAALRDWLKTHSSV